MKVSTEIDELRNMQHVAEAGLQDRCLKKNTKPRDKTKKRGIEIIWV